MNIADKWFVKSYKYYKELVDELVKRNARICTIGFPNEYIKGTDNFTGIGLYNSIGLIANAELVITNDTGFYHIASLLNKKTIVIFTFTSIKKNYDARHNVPVYLIGYNYEIQFTPTKTHNSY